MMEKRKRYRIADAEIEIAFTENYTEIICRDYEVKAEGKPDFVIEVTDEEVEREKKKSEPGASKGIIESLCMWNSVVREAWIADKRGSAGAGDLYFEKRRRKYDQKNFCNRWISGSV